MSETRSSFQVHAPGRINLIGEHVDYQDGLVMPMAIDRGVTAELRPVEAPVIRLVSDGFASIECPLDGLARQEGEAAWANYLLGVIDLYRARGITCPGFEARIRSDLPSGAGLSSSAALETLAAVMVEQLSGESLGTVERAQLCQQAEHEWAGVPCGIMDQLAVGAGVAGHALLIDCRSLDIKPVPIPNDLALVVADTRVKHALVDGAYRERREDCEAAAEILGVDALRDATEPMLTEHEKALGDRRFNRALHVIRENARVQLFASMLGVGEVESLGHAMLESHESLRDLYEVSCPELDHLVETAYAFGPGLVGARMTGGGFGGSTINLVRREAREAFTQHLQQAFLSRFDRSAPIFQVSAADGAGVLP